MLNLFPRTTSCDSAELGMCLFKPDGCALCAKHLNYRSDVSSAFGLYPLCTERESKTQWHLHLLLVTM